MTASTIYCTFSFHLPASLTYLFFFYRFPSTITSHFLSLFSLFLSLSLSQIELGMLVEGLSDALVPSVGELCSDPIASLLFLSLVFPLSTLFLRFRISPHYGLCNSITRIVLDLC